MPSWAYLAGLVVFLAACVVWGLILFGAYAASLPHAAGWLKHFALADRYSKPVMKAMVRELIFIVGIIAIAVGAYINQASVQERTERVLARLLVEVSGDSSPQSLIDALVPLSDVPTDLQATTMAYLEYLTRVSKGTTPNVDLIRALLPEERNAFDLRLLGLSHDYLAERTIPKDPELQREHFSKARESYLAALAAIPALDPSADVYLRSKLEGRTRSNLAGVSLSLAELEERGSDARREMLLAAQKDYLYLKSTFGGRAAFLNLAATYSLLGEYDPKYFASAIAVLEEVHKTKVLSEADKKFIRGAARDLDQMHELRPLARHLAGRQGKRWDRFIDDVFPASRI